MELTSFVDVVPTKSITTLLSFVRGQQPSKADLALAGINVQSFAAGKFLGDPTPPIFGSAAPSDEAAEAILVQLAPDAEGTFAAAPVDSAGLLLLLQWVSPLILKWLLK